MSALFKIDPSLILPWSEDLISEEPFEYPFVAKYHRKKKKLIFIASLHSSDEKSATFDIIKKYIEKNEIDFLILEGFPHSMGETPQKMTDWATPQGKDGFYEGYETAFAIKQAHKHGVPFIGSEPDNEYIIKGSAKSGYDANDIWFYFFIQQVFQYKNNGVLDPNNLEGFYNKFKAENASSFPSALKYHDFLFWYKKKNARDFHCDEIDELTAAPFADGELFIQRVSSCVCMIRDKFMLSVIEEKMNEYRAVLAIFGGSHWSTQKLALAGTFGKPKFSNN